MKNKTPWLPKKEKGKHRCPHCKGTGKLFDTFTWKYFTCTKCGGKGF